MGYKHGIKIARSALGYLGMADELKNRMELASGAIRELADASKSQNTSKKNQKKVDLLDSAYKTLRDLPYDQRALEILAEKLVEICADIIEDNTNTR